MYSHQYVCGLDYQVVRSPENMGVGDLCVLFTLLRFDVATVYAANEDMRASGPDDYGIEIISDVHRQTIILTDKPSSSREQYFCRCDLGCTFVAARFIIFWASPCHDGLVRKRQG